MSAPTAVARALGGARAAVVPERVAVTAIAACVLAVHDVGAMFSQSFWNDESWVAVTTRYPLGELPSVTSSTPIGWTFLLRLVPFGGPERLRLVPLLFTVAAVFAAASFARNLGWAQRWQTAAASVSAAVAMLFVPAMLVRDDLKQYTADATAALILLALTSRIERAPTRRNLTFLAAGTAVGMLFSDASAFVGIAAFVSLGAVALARRQWPFARDVAIAAAGAAVGMGAVYEVFDARAVVPGLVQYWDGFFVPRTSVGAAVGFVWHSAYVAASDVGLGPFWLVVVLVVAGLATLVRLGRLATGLAFVVLSAEMVVLAAARRYPLLDLRTSTFLFAAFAVLAAIGVVGIAVECCRWIRWELAAGLVAVCVALFAAYNGSLARGGYIVPEDVGLQTAYVAAHRSPQDVILVNLSSVTGFAYYWPKARIGVRKTDVVLQGYLPTLPHDPAVVLVHDRGAPAVDAGLAEAQAHVSSQPGARLWLIRTHVSATEDHNWRVGLSAYGLRAKAIGPRGLVVLDPVG